MCIPGLWVPIWGCCIVVFFLDWWFDVYCGGVNWCYCVDCGFMGVLTALT